jgi:hypothetical protein
MSVNQVLAHMATTTNPQDREELLQDFKNVRNPPRRQIFAGGASAASAASAAPS